MSVIKINKENFASEVLNSNKPVLLDFYADWCGPCRMVGPIVSEIANERSDVKVGKINVDEQPELAAQFHACCDQKRKARESGRGLQTERAN